MDGMKKFAVTYHEESGCTYIIEAHNKEEAENLFRNKFRNSEEFNQTVINDVADGFFESSIIAEDAEENEDIDFTYEEMKEGN